MREEILQTNTFLQKISTKKISKFSPILDFLIQMITKV